MGSEDRIGIGLKFLFALFVGFFLLEAGLTGKLGSMLGAIIDPSNMVASSAPPPTGGSGSTGG